jgi:histidinol-phosphate/aromatic aminotransferase/cobyric acid decarboxylase-like protein
MLISLPTFSAYYEFARGPVVAYHLDQRRKFRLDLDALEALIVRHAPQTVVIINPNNPDGGLIPHGDLVGFLERVHSRVNQVIVDESFNPFTTEAVPATVADLVQEMPNLVVVNSLSKSHGIAGLRLGYAVMSAQRAKTLRDRSLWNLNAFAEWFCTLLGDPNFQLSYEGARRRYVRETRALFSALDTLSGAKAFPSAANFALLRLDRPAAEVAGALLARHGIYVRDCADKRGLDHGERFIRIAARTATENLRIVDGLRAVLSNRLTKPRGPIAYQPAVSTR